MSGLYDFFFCFARAFKAKLVSAQSQPFSTMQSLNSFIERLVIRNIMLIGLLKLPYLRLNKLRSFNFTGRGLRPFRGKGQLTTNLVS